MIGEAEKKGRTALLVGLWILILTALDQGSKLLVKSLFSIGDRVYLSSNGIFHLHPVYNFRTVELIEKRAAESPFGKGFWWTLEILEIALALGLAILLLWGLSRLLRLAGLDTHRKLFILLVALAGAMFVCGASDRLFWEGALDFFCIIFPMNDGTGARQTGHFTFDVKDLYVYLFGILTFYCVLRVSVDFLIFRIKDPEGFRAFRERLKERFRRKKDRAEDDRAEDDTAEDDTAEDDRAENDPAENGRS